MKKRIIIIFLIIILLFALKVYLNNFYQIPVLMYHSINQGSEESRLVVSPESFQRQMYFLKKNNYNILSLDEYVDFLKEKKPLKHKSAVITFDDGFADNYTQAFPILKKYSIPATIFVVTEWVGNKKDMLNWEQVEILSDSKLIDIGSHTITHCLLPDAKNSQVIREIRESKNILDSRLKKETKFFCYPCGFLNSYIKETARLAGFKGACATHPGFEFDLNDEFAIRRIRISRTADNLIVFWAQVSGFYTLFKDRRINNK
ncbi:MAG: polysaccharide deacetylase family protein [Candidatus Omnitrophota bacterium]